MMKFKKFLAAAMTGAMMFGSVAMAVPVVSVYAEATETFRTNITVKPDYTDATLTIESKVDNYIILEVLKIDRSGAEKGVSNKLSYKLEEGSVTIDLSFLSLNKGCTIDLRGDSDMFATRTQPLTFTAQAKKDSFKFAAVEKNGKLSIADSFSIRGTALTAEQVGTYQYKPLYGSTWKSLSLFEIDTTAVAGTTILIRKTPVTEGENVVVGGAEAKVKIPAAPKMPKVTVDYKKGTIAIPAKTEVKILYQEAKGSEPVAQAAGSTEGVLTVKADMYTKDITLLTDEIVGDFIEYATPNFSIVEGVTIFTDVGCETELNTEANGFDWTTYVTYDDTDSVVKLAGNASLYVFEPAQIDASSVGTYFEIKDGTVSRITDSVKIYSDEACATEIDFAAEGFDMSQYVTIETPAPEPSATTMTETPTWESVTTKASYSPEDLLKLCKIDASKHDSILKSGFVVAVRTALDSTKKKAASSISFTTVGETSAATAAADQQSVTFEGGVIVKCEVSEDGDVSLKFEGNVIVEYKLDENATSWKTAKSGSKISGAGVGKAIFVRIGGDKTNGVLPSKVGTITPKEAAEGSGSVVITADKTAVDKPTTDTPATVTFTSVVKDAAGSTVENPTIEWKLDDASTADNGVSIANGVLTITKNATVTTVKVTATVDGVPSNEVTITINSGNPAATITIGTDEELTAAAAKLVAGANAIAALEIPLTITVKDAEGNAVNDTSKYTVTITKGSETTAAAGVAFASGNLTFNAANATSPTIACPALTAGEKYVVTVTYGTGADAVTEKKELTVAAAQVSNP